MVNLSYSKDLIGDQLGRVIARENAKLQAAGIPAPVLMADGDDLRIYNWCILCEEHKSRVNWLGICTQHQKWLDGAGQ